jgi:hypothetical protein
MTAMRTMVVTICLVGLWQAAHAQEPAPKRIAPEDAKNHVGETAIVCGKVVDTKVPRNGLKGYGLPASFYMEEPEPHAVFYFIEFVPGPEATNQARPDYNGKRMCVTGKISASATGGPVIIALKHSQVKPEAPAK